MLTRYSIRQRQLRAARKDVESILAEAVYHEFAILWRELYPHLRRLAEKKPATPVSKRKTKRMLRKMTFLGGTALWDEFRDRLETRVTEAMQSGAVTLAGIQNVYQQHLAGASYQGAEIVPNELVEAHKAQIGYRIKNITEKTKSNVARRVSDWYNTPETTMGDLVEDLQPTFGEARARSIAITETTWLNSRVIETRMEKLGITEWWWQTMRDEIVCRKCAAKHGKVFKRGDPMPPDDTHPNCIIGGTMVSAPPILRTYTRWYEGEVIEIETVSGNFLTITENHPILTLNGWVTAGQLYEGSYIFKAVASKGGVCCGPHYQNSPSRIEDVIESFSRSGDVRTVSVPVSPEDFHGDGKGSNVCVIRSNSLLRDNGNIVSDEEVDHGSFVVRFDIPHNLESQCSFASFFERDFSSPDCLMSGCRVPGVFLPGAVRHHQSIRFGVAPNRNPSTAQSVCNNSAVDVELLGDCIDGNSSLIFGNDFVIRNARNSFVEVNELFTNIAANFGTASQQIPFHKNIFQRDTSDMEDPTGFSKGVPRNIKLDRILKISRKNFSGHVYNLETVTGWYVANNIITHNCRCNAVEVVKVDEILEAVTEPETTPLSATLLDAHEASAAGEETAAEIPLMEESPQAVEQPKLKGNKKAYFAVYNTHKDKALKQGMQLSQNEIDDALVNAKAFWGPNTNPDWLKGQQKQLNEKIEAEKKLVQVWQARLSEAMATQNPGHTLDYFAQLIGVGSEDKLDGWYSEEAKTEMKTLVMEFQTLSDELTQPQMPMKLSVNQYVDLKHQSSSKLLTAQELAAAKAFAQKTWPGKANTWAWVDTQISGQLWVEPAAKPKKVKVKPPVPSAPVKTQTPTPIAPAATTQAGPKPLWQPGEPLNHDLLKQVDLHDVDPGWAATPGLKPRYGAVLVDDQGRVLLREPKDHYDNYVWTFAKGGPDYSGEHPVDVIEREVLEETGHEVEIIGLVPGGFSSGNSTAYYVLARSKSYQPQKMDKETVNTVWATRDEAEQLISQTTNDKGRQRDLAVLNAAIAEHNKIKSGKADYSHLFAGIKPPTPPKPKYQFSGQAVDVFAQKPDFPTDVTGLKVLKGLGGSTGAELVQDTATGRKFVRKRGKNDAHLLEEAHADAAYQAAGINVPDFQVYQTNGGPVKLSHYVDNAITLADVMANGTTEQKAAVKTKLQAGFAMDALMGNWDVIGMSADNILVDEQGEVWRIDNGGSLRMRAQGQPKGSDWSAYPTELWTMRGAVRMPGDPKIEGANAHAVGLFGDMSYEAVMDSAREILKQRDGIVAAVPAETRDEVIGRLDNLDHLVETNERMSQTQWTDQSQDHFGRSVTEIRKVGITERSAGKFSTKREKQKTSGRNNWDVALRDENGKLFDKLRGDNSLTNDIYSLIDKNGGNRRVIEDWLSDQAGNSWNDKVRAVKYWLAQARGGNFDDYWWGEGRHFSSRDQGIKECRLAYEASCAKYGPEVFDRTLRMYHAFTYEYLSKAELPNKSVDGHRIKLIRTESSALVNGIDNANPGDTNVKSRRGACESCSIVNPVFVEGQEVTTQEVNITDIMATYLTSRHAGSHSCSLYGDRENEFVAILGRIRYDYHGTGPSSYHG